MCVSVTAGLHAVAPAEFAAVPFDGLDRVDGADSWFASVRPDLFRDVLEAYEDARRHYGEPDALHPIAALHEAWFIFALACFYQGLKAGAVTEHYRTSLLEALTA